ncbi:MAG: cell wall-binding repeat-containing protein [Coriobacteriia bacterium]|nr:cell wall-binding repeat-containing protein [Coriobacteriia bacterium]
MSASTAFAAPASGLHEGITPAWDTWDEVPIDYLPSNRHVPTIDDDFKDDSVVVVLKHAYSEVNKEWAAADFKVREIKPVSELNIGSFKQSDIAEIEDLSRVDNPEGNDLVNWGRFHSILRIKLRHPGKANVLAAIIALEELDMVLAAEPDYNGIAVPGIVVPGDYYSGPITRVAGADRYATAIEASKADFESADAVIIATGRGYADALSASALAGALDAPLLLTRPDVLSDGIVDEIGRLGARQAYIMGSAAAVSAGVESALISAGFAVERVAGTDRYATSAAVAQKIATLEGTAFTKSAFLARGDDFADGLSASPIAYKNKIPVVLTPPAMLAEDALGAIEGLGITDVTILGSTAAISSDIEDAVKTLGTGSEVRRISGANRYETAQKIAEYALENSLATKDFIGVATGQDFPDALAGGVATGKHGGILVLTAASALSSGWTACLSRAYAHVRPDIQVYGGRNVLSDSVMSRLDDLLLSDSIPDGTPIPFTASRMWEQGSGYQGSMQDALVVASTDELDAFLSTSQKVTHTYDEAFFEGSAIIIIFPPGIDISFASSSLAMQVDSLTRRNDEVCIGLTGLMPSGGVAHDDVHNYYIMIDVKKADIEGVDEFSCLLLRYDTY